MVDASKKYNIICFSNQLWDFPNWTNKKHVMTRLAKQGHTVLFVDPPINVGRVFVRQLCRGYWGMWRVLTQQKRDVSTGVHVFTPLNFVPFGNFMAKVHAKRINSIAKRLFDPDRKTILWIYHVEIAGLRNYLGTLDYGCLVYDCVDNYESFPKHNTPAKKDFVRTQEKFLAEKADLVFATTPLLVNKLSNFNKRVFFTPNVGDYDKFKDSKKLKDQVPADLLEISRPRVGFTGALDEYKFDTKLMEKVACDNPDVSFVLIGQMALKDKEAAEGDTSLTHLENVYLMGSRPYDILHLYYAGFDAAIIPYQLNDYTVGGCFPVKFHDSLAAGLPTIVTDLPAYAPFKDVSYISKTYDEFSANVKKALEEDNSRRVKARQAVAKDNSWEGKVQKMLEYINAVV